MINWQTQVRNSEKMNQSLEFAKTMVSVQVEPGKPGAEVSKKNYKPKKEFAHRMCTGVTNHCDAQTEFFE